MARVTPSEFADKWQRRTSAATADYTAGVKKVTTAPGVKAAAAANQYQAGVAAAVASGQWQRNVAKVSLTDWQNAAATKGAQRIASGVQAAAPKMNDVATKLLAAVDAAVADVEKTPRGDINANIQRAVTFMQSMSARAPKKSG